jgi:putative FmdB family regulatory protein
MPIYEYRCDACGHELEAMQKMSDAPLSDCPACGQPALKKLISAAGFRLKGGGWYETDFKRGGTKRNLHGADEKAGGAEKGKKSDQVSKEKPANKGSGGSQSAAGVS